MLDKFNFAKSLTKKINKIVDNPKFLIHYFLLRTIRGKKSNLINNIFLFLTLRCNQRCIICGFWGEKGLCKNREFFDLYKEDMEEEVAFKVINEVKKMKPQIILTGGEPLLHNNWYKIAEYANKNKLKVNLQTNGLLIDKYENEILNTVDYLNVSLDAPYEELNNKIRSLGFDNVVNNLKKILIKKSNRLRVNLWYTINELNYQYLESMVEFVKEFNNIDGIVFQHPTFCNKEMIEAHKKRFNQINYFDNCIWASVEFNLYIDLDILNRSIDNLMSNKYKFNIEFYPNLRNKLKLKEFYNDNINITKNYCLSPYLECIIYPNGDIRLCQDFIIGNLKEDNFINIWNNKKAQYIRENIKKNLSSVCKRCCNLYSY